MSNLLSAPNLPPVLPISLLNRLVRERLESGFPLCWVSGEISNLVQAASGHVYFSLKDAKAQVRCVMFRQRVQLLAWRLANGQHVEACVLVSLYEARGDFQLTVESMRQAGQGLLYEKFLRLKEQLTREGVFDAAQKRPLPSLPSVVGIVTSPQAAALQDVLSTLQRRAPYLKIILYPTPVQGADAAVQIVAAIQVANQRRECEALILCRGGGSLEDLWAFNDEQLARIIQSSQIPIITGIGHETDFSLADFAATQRAPTPTAAAEILVPAAATLLADLDNWQLRLKRQVTTTLAHANQALDTIAYRLQDPAQKLAQQHTRILDLHMRLQRAVMHQNERRQLVFSALSERLARRRPELSVFVRQISAAAFNLHNAWHALRQDKKTQLARYSNALTHLNPHAVLARGYSISMRTNGEIIRHSNLLEPNEQITVSFSTGSIDAKVMTIRSTTDSKLPVAKEIL